MKALEFVRNWWRPVAAVGMSAAIWVNGVIIPLMTKQPTDMVALATLIAAVSTAFAVREVGKYVGNE